MMLAVAACQTRGEVETNLVSGSQGDVYNASALAAGSVAPPAESARVALLNSKKFNPDLLAEASASTGKQYFIDFRARYALSYGHTFVVFGRLNEHGQEIQAEVAGLAPKSDNPAVYTLGHIVPVESSTGWTDGDTEYEYLTAIWRVMLTKPEYDKVVADIRRLQARLPFWHAVLYNCNSFAGDVAVSMGYRGNFHWLTPRNYVTSLRKMNGGPDPIAWSAPSARTAPGL